MEKAMMSASVMGLFDSTVVGRGVSDAFVSGRKALSQTT